MPDDWLLRTRNLVEDCARLVIADFLVDPLKLHAFETRSSDARQDKRVYRITDITNALRRYRDVDPSRLWITEAIFLDRQKTTRRALSLPEL